MRSRHLAGPFRIVFALGLALILTTSTLAQRPPAPVNPLAPVLKPLLPLGIQQGTTLELTLTGANLADPIAVSTSIPGAKVTIPNDNNNGKDAGKLRVVLEVPKETPLGYYPFRLTTAAGVSNLRLFCVDDLPAVAKGPNIQARGTAQAVTAPCVISGHLAAETTDHYKITVQANQRLSFDVLGHRLGSPIDPQLSIVDTRTNKEVAFSNDAPGLQTDSRLTHTFKEAGEYLIEVRDVMYRGGEEYVYRLRIGDFPCATTPLPLAIKRGSKAMINFAGAQLEGVAPVEVTAPAEAHVDTLWVTPKGPNGLSGWPVALLVSDLDETLEQEPNNEPAKANRVPVPGAVTGRFEVKGDIDTYVVSLKKGARTIIEAHSLEMYSPTEVYLTLKNAQGGEVAKSNPQTPGNPKIDFNPPADGDYFLVAEHLLSWGRPEEVYRITFTPYEPGFDVVLLTEKVDVVPGGWATLPVLSIGRRDFNGPIELTVVGPPGITGQRVFLPVQNPPNNQPLGYVFINAAADVAPGAYPVRIQAKANINGKDVVTFASTQSAISLSLGNLVYPPRELNTAAVVAVTQQKPPFTLTAKLEQVELLRGQPAKLTISAERIANFAEEIALTPINLPANVAPMLKNIPKGQSSVEVQLTPAVAAALGTFPISFNGKSKHENREYNVIAAPLPLVLVQPFELAVEPAKLEIKAGDKVKLKVIASRKGGYKGPIALELRNLPGNVTAPKVNIEMDKDEVEIEVTAAANAAVGDKGDVNVLGTAPAAGNQQNASANFTVSVPKP
jgi:hypothetical protein